MRHVIAFDISMGKSYMVIYNAQKQCIFEKEIKQIPLVNYSHLAKLEVGASQLHDESNLSSP
ncbi:hypothetical protein A6283_26275 [Bacillus wiedmannii]|nr:hypothetical protein A6283_26275 [Bacillus wiedmannii]OAK34185.1 hypothetical protein A6284_27995 [Bacillus wiedmannii]OAK41183.1 hypothetical protein A6285_23940 [Bacillus wiedmannii]